MSFRISDFKTTMDRFGGPARPNLFEVQIIKDREPNSSMDSRNISFFCTNVNFPGISVEQGQMNNVAQLPTSFPMRMTPQPITATFLLDSDHSVLSFFHNWLQRVMNFSTKDGTFGAIDTEGEGFAGGQLPYELGYKDDYACRMNIRHYSTESLGKGSNSKYYETVLDNIYPYSISDTALAWDSNDQFATITVSFAYDQIHYSADRVGTQIERKSGGLLDTLSDVASFIDVAKQTIGQGKITSIQDAINRLQRVRGSYDNLSGFFGEPTNAQMNKTIDEAGKRMSARVNADLQQKIDAKLSAQIEDNLNNLPGGG